MPMELINVNSYCNGKWLSSSEDQSNGGRIICSAVTGEPIAVSGGRALDFQSMLDHARQYGGEALRSMNFHDRARALKALATYLSERKEELYTLSTMAGCTRSDSWIDIDGGIGTLFAYASKGRRELPDSKTFLDGDVEQLSRNGTFIGQHICTPKRGVGIHINAFNFPVWGMLEKLAPTLLAGVPAIIKPATDTSYIAQACFRMMVDSNTFPEGSFQLIAGGTGNLLELLTPQDVVSFTGSADTALMLRSNSHILKNAIPFIAEQDSLNATILGQDCSEDSPEFEIFANEVIREMTTKAGQKCSAIRRIIVPQQMMAPALEILCARLDEIAIGDPGDDNTKMGPLVSQRQRNDVLSINHQIGSEAAIMYNRDNLRALGVDENKGAFITPTLFHCADPDASERVHALEAFGPTATIMPYRDTGHACELLNRGGGSLVASLFTKDATIASKVVQNSAAWHGRIYINNQTSAKEATGHGSPMPHMVHGGPGRAGGSEELGGIRAVMHYMQRTALQGSPDMLSAVAETWLPGSSTYTEQEHPFTRTFHQLQLGETFKSDYRKILLKDIEQFAHFTGDTFYAHMDEEAAKANPFFPGRVAHGYLLLSFAAGLFVQPDPGPVLANTGLTDLSFQKPVSPDDSIRVELTVKRKTRRNDEYGEVRWHVALFNQSDEPVATYTLHTMNQYQLPG